MDHSHLMAHVRNLPEFYQWVEEFSLNLENPSIILLSGPLGVGKTEFVKTLALSLGAKEQVTSPTFALINEYETPVGRIDHIDLYRLEDEADLETSGFWDLFEKDRGFIVVEWADYLNRKLLPLGWRQYLIEILKLDDESRSIKLKA